LDTWVTVNGTERSKIWQSAMGSIALLPVVVLFVTVAFPVAGVPVVIEQQLIRPA
jgi:hypothetical protein